MLPFDDLPQHQRAKDYLFRAVVHALLPMPVVVKGSMDGLVGSFPQLRLPNPFSRFARRLKQLLDAWVGAFLLLNTEAVFGRYPRLFQMLPDYCFGKSLVLHHPYHTPQITRSG